VSSPTTTIQQLIRASHDKLAADYWALADRLVYRHLAAR
jgi:hypothetical protein